jgi:hypothetical protein
LPELRSSQLCYHWAPNLLSGHYLLEPRQTRSCTPKRLEKTDSNHKAQREVIESVSKSQTPVTEIVTPHLLLDLEGCRKIGESIPIRLLSKEEYHMLHDSIREGIGHGVNDKVSVLADNLDISSPAVLFIAIDKISATRYSILPREPSELTFSVNYETPFPRITPSQSDPGHYSGTLTIKTRLYFMLQYGLKTMIWSSPHIACLGETCKSARPQGQSL